MRKIVLDCMYPSLRSLYDLWAEKGWDKQVAEWSAVCDVDLSQWSPNMVIIEVVNGDYVYRFYGSRLREAFGRDLTGKAISSLPEDVLSTEARSLIEYEYRCARARKEPIWRSYTADFEGEFQTWQRLVLPVSSTGDAVDMILIAAYATDL